MNSDIPEISYQQLTMDLSISFICISSCYFLKPFARLKFLREMVLRFHWSIVATIVANIEEIFYVSVNRFEWSLRYSNLNLAINILK